MSAARNSFQNRTKGAYANNQHQLNAEIKENPRKTSFYRAIKLCVGVLLILDSDATPFTRSLGKKRPSKLKGVQVSIANCQRSDLHQSFNKVSFPFKFSQIHDHFLHLNSTLTVKNPCLPCLRIFSACQASPLWNKTFVMFFCCCLGIFVVDISFFTFICGLFGAAKNGGFGVALKNPSRWKSVTWYKLGGSNGKWYRSCRFVSPLHSQNFFQKIGQRW